MFYQGYRNFYGRLNQNYMVAVMNIVFVQGSECDLRIYLLFNYIPQCHRISAEFLPNIDKEQTERERPRSKIIPRFNTDEKYIPSSGLSPR